MCLREFFLMSSYWGLDGPMREQIFLQLPKIQRVWLLQLHLTGPARDGGKKGILDRNVTAVLKNNGSHKRIEDLPNQMPYSFLATEVTSVHNH